MVGGGPAGLMAAQVLSRAGVAVHLYDAMPSTGRKFLLAGRGGLNLTHSEPTETFLSRYGVQRAVLEPWIREFDAQAVRAWAQSLGIETFVGSSGRVFPTDMKAAPLLRAWLHRLRAQGVVFHMRHRWMDGLSGILRFQTPAGEVSAEPAAVVFALGGASWPRLGSDGAWWPLFEAAKVALAPLAPANCGFDVAAWTPHLRERFAGAALKNVALRFEDFAQVGECVITDTGLEGGLVYAASSTLRDAIARDGHAVPTIDLLPQRERGFVEAEVARPRGTRSMATHLKSRLGLGGVKAALLHEILDRDGFHDAGRLAAAIKALPLRLLAARPLAEAISTAGGVRFDACDDTAMLRLQPGVFCAGEMLDWEAPTGGYLLTACLASGRRAGLGALRFLGID